jgi:hypothetical protein
MFNLMEEMIGRAFRTNPQGPAAQGPAPEAPPGEMTVQDNPFRPRGREGLVTGGTFSMGRTGGNIIGILGDALRAQGGLDPLYAPRLRESRESDAMIDFIDDPKGALENLAQVSPDKVPELWDTVGNRQSQDAVREAQVREAADNYQKVTRDRAAAYLGAATEKTWPQMRQMVLKWYEDRDEVPPNIPETFDAPFITSLANGAIDVTDQRELAEDRRYNDARIAEGKREEFGRNYRTNLVERMDASETEFTQDRIDRRSREDRQSREEIAATRGGSGRPKTLPRVKRDKNGRIVLVK